MSDDAFYAALGAPPPPRPDWMPQGPQRTDEVERIERLPRRVLDPGAVPDLTPLYARPGGTLGLRPIQNAMLWEAAAARAGHGGLVASAAVGSGKTLTTLLLPDVMRSRRALLLVPATVKEQLLNEDIPYYSAHFELPLERLRIETYESLSTDSDADVLFCDPDLDLVICDEAHCLRDKTSARSRRFERFVVARPRVRFCFLSGTLTTRSIFDYAHFCEWALRSGSPVPFAYRELLAWSATLDAGEDRAPAGALAAWCNPGEDVRSAFQRRLSETTGVVITTAGSCSAALYIRRVDVPQPQAVKDALATLRGEWRVGEELFDQAMAVSAAERQLAQGYYLRWDWPGGVVDEEWVAARSGWFGAVRAYLRYNNRPGMDSPSLLEEAAKTGKWDGGLAAWQAWDAVRDRPQPPTVVDWTSTYLVAFAADWAATRRANGEQGIVWFANDCMGEALAAAGIPAFFGGDTRALKACRAPVVACSIQAFHRSLNLQRYWWNLVLQCPGNGQVWEQLLGRTHRQGQTHDEVYVDLVMPSGASWAAWKQAHLDAEYALENFKQPQKLLMASKSMGKGGDDVV
jgi:hypothetical protein